MGEAWMKAKKQLKIDIKNGTIPLDPMKMSGSEVHRLKPLYLAVDKKKFLTNLRSLRKRLDGGEEENKAWKVCKMELERDLKDGIIPLDKDQMSDLQIYNMVDRPHYRIVSEADFLKKLSKLREEVKTIRATSIKEAAGLSLDLKKFPPALYNAKTGEPRWEGSQAQVSLRHDVAEYIKTKGRKPLVSEIYSKRDEYKDFYSWDTIRKKIHEEERRQKFINYLDRVRKEKREHLQKTVSKL
jgi:hypothetical protein